jgi:hypothetical protein
MLALWSMARSPLILGANLTKLDEWTTRLLTAREVLRIDQTATASRQVADDAGVIAWTAELPGGEEALAVFNTGDAAISVRRPLAAYGLKSGGWQVEDAWTGKALGRRTEMEQTIPAHDCVVWVLR